MLTDTTPAAPEEQVIIDRSPMLDDIPEDPHRPLSRDTKLMVPPRVPDSDD